MEELSLRWNTPEYLSTSFLFCDLLVVSDNAKMRSEILLQLNMDLFACGQKACCIWVGYDLELEANLRGRTLMKVMMYTDI